MINPQIPDDVQELIDNLRLQAEAQPWYAKFSNTLTTAVGLVLAALWVATASGIDLPDDVTKWVLGVIGVLTVLGVYKTPNGVTDTEVKRVQIAAEYIGEHRRED